MGYSNDCARFHSDRCYELKLLREYGLTGEDYAAIREEQDWRCAICRQEFGSERPCVDHDHETGKVRGLLCRSCNRGIGFLRDSSWLCFNAYSYLTRKDVKCGVQISAPNSG